MDEKQDYDLISLTETGNKTTMKFKRQFDTCDDGQDNKIEVRCDSRFFLYFFLVSFILVRPYRVVGAQPGNPVETRGPFLESLEKLWQNLKQFDYKAVFFFFFHIYTLDTNRGSLHTRSLRCMYLSVFKYRVTKNGFSGPKRFRGFQETGPRAGGGGGAAEGRGIRSFSYQAPHGHLVSL